ncbi:MAG: class I SAM-dependent methyltransferase [Cytophagales bacterium]|nr:class I SAM-dependent methyltransferase [Cytophagales bacterium]
MTAVATHVQSHYHRPALFEDILVRLKEQEIDLQNVKRKHIGGVDEFHVRGAEVSRELAQAIELNGSRVLDVGCGIGGPSRMLADEFNCTVTGIDLSAEFIRTAKKLSELVGLNDCTTFVEGDATNLPFDNESFDVVWTQHVQMNIRDKQTFYKEIERVLAPNGTFTFYDIFRSSEEEVDYPMPWADESAISFLFRADEMENLLEQLGFKRIESNFQTNQGIVFFENLLDRIQESGPPKLGLNVLMGDSTKTKIGNLLKGLKERKIILKSGIYKKGA